MSKQLFVPPPQKRKKRWPIVSLAKHCGNLPCLIVYGCVVEGSLSTERWSLCGFGWLLWVGKRWSAWVNHQACREGAEKKKGIERSVCGLRFSDGCFFSSRKPGEAQWQPDVLGEREYVCVGKREREREKERMSGGVGNENWQSYTTILCLCVVWKIILLKLSIISCHLSLCHFSVCVNESAHLSGLCMTLFNPQSSLTLLAVLVWLASKPVWTVCLCLCCALATLCVWRARSLGYITWFTRYPNRTRHVRKHCKINVHTHVIRSLHPQCLHAPTQTLVQVLPPISSLSFRSIYPHAISSLVIPTWVIERWTEVRWSVVVIRCHIKSKEEKARKEESWLETIRLTVFCED